METAGEPAPDTVWAELRKSFQVLGAAVTPAASKAAVLYQTSDLLAAFTYTPYCLPLYAPSSCQPVEKFFADCAFASAPSGLSQPLSANWWSTPTCGRNA